MPTKMGMGLSVFLTALWKGLETIAPAGGVLVDFLLYQAVRSDALWESVLNS